MGRHRGNEADTAFRAKVVVLPIAVLLVLDSGIAAAPVPHVRDFVSVQHVTHELKWNRAPKFAAVGDSITAGWAPMNSWTVYTTDVEYAAGWFQVGLRSDQIVAGALANGKPDADVLVIMGCTNDIDQQLDWKRCLAEWDTLADAFDMPVIVSAVAPSNIWPSSFLDYNAELETHAASQGWTFVDPYAAVRNVNGTFVEGYQRDPAHDPTHPNNAAQEIAGAVLSEAIVAVAHGDKLI